MVALLNGYMVQLLSANNPQPSTTNPQLTTRNSQPVTHNPKHLISPIS